MIIGIVIGILISIIFLIIGIYIKIILKNKKIIDHYIFIENNVSFSILFKIDHIGQYVDVEFVSRTQNNQTIQYFHPRISFDFSDIIIENINNTGKNKYVFNYFYSTSRFIKNELLKKMNINIEIRRLSDIDVRNFIDKIIFNKRSSIMGWTNTTQELDKLLKNSII